MSDFGKFFNIGMNIGLLTNACSYNFCAFPNFNSFCRYQSPIDFNPGIFQFNSILPTPQLNLGNFNSPIFNFSSFAPPTIFINSTTSGNRSANISSAAPNKNHSARTKYWAQMTDQEMKQVYGNYDYDITSKYKGTAANIDKVLGGVLKGKGKAFMDAQEKYGINAAALAAICMLESGNGKSSLAKNNNNVSGMGGQGNWKKYNSVEECINDTASKLKNNYITPPEKGIVKSLTKLYQINSRYCPGKETSENVHWAERVTGNIKKIENA